MADPYTPPPTTSGGNSSSGSNSSSSSSSSGGSSSGGKAITASAKAGTAAYQFDADEKARFLQYLRDFTGDYKLNAIPKELQDAILASRGRLSTTQLQRWVKSNKPQWYLESPAAVKLLNEKQQEVRQLLGLDKYSFAKDGKMGAEIAKWLLSDNPSDITLFEKLVKSSTTLASTYPGFAKWYAATKSSATYADGGQALASFKTAKDKYEQLYRDALKTTTVDAAFIQAALEGNWDATQFDINLKSNGAWQATVGATRDDLFKRSWDALFAGTAAQGNYDPALMVKFRTGSMEFDAFVETDLKASSVFAAAFPEYAAWENEQHVKGAPEGSVTVATWKADVEKKKQLANDYRELYLTAVGDPNAKVDEDLIARAVAGNWSQAMFELQFRQTGAYTQTSEYRNAAASFTQYWQSVLGPDSLPDPDLVQGFALSGSGDPASFFDRVKNTSEFRTMYPQYDAFSAAQWQQGVKVDPLMYNEYAAAFKNAFAGVGLDVPMGLEGQFFRSGESTSDFTGHVNLFSENKDSYNWQTGQEADMNTAIDLGDKTKGGLLRKRMQQALTQQKAYMQSSFGRFGMEENKAGDVTRKI